MVNITQDSPSLVTPPQNTAAMIGGFQPQSPVMNGTVQPQSPAAMGNFQPNSPAMTSPYQPQSPVAVSNTQPQAIVPMQIHSKVYGDHGANNGVIGSDGKRNWSYGLMDFTGRCGLCCWATWCPCIVFSKTRQRLRSLQYQGRPLEGGGDTYSGHCCIYSVLTVIGHSWMMQVQPRLEIRERYGIRGHVINDWATPLCCNSCALTQERREVELEEASFQVVQQSVQVDGK